MSRCEHRFWMWPFFLIYIFLLYNTFYFVNSFAIKYGSYLWSITNCFKGELIGKRIKLDNILNKLTGPIFEFDNFIGKFETLHYQLLITYNCNILLFWREIQLERKPVTKSSIVDVNLRIRLRRYIKRNDLPSKFLPNSYKSFTWQPSNVSLIEE